MTIQPSVLCGSQCKGVLAAKLVTVGIHFTVRDVGKSTPPKGAIILPQFHVTFVLDHLVGAEYR